MFPRLYSHSPVTPVAGNKGNISASLGLISSSSQIVLNLGGERSVIFLTLMILIVIHLSSNHLLCDLYIPGIGLLEAERKMMIPALDRLPVQ